MAGNTRDIVKPPIKVWLTNLIDTPLVYQHCIAPAPNVATASEGSYSRV
jgi:hypothetical protein